MKSRVEELGMMHDDNVMNDKTYPHPFFLQKLQNVILCFDLSNIRNGTKQHVACRETNRTILTDHIQKRKRLPHQIKGTEKSRLISSGAHGNNLIRTTLFLQQRRQKVPGNSRHSGSGP